MSGGLIALIVLGCIVVIAAIVAAWIISSYNGFIKQKNNIDEAFSTMDVYLKKRYDLIPNLVETVKGYAKHEKETLENVIAARNSAMNATDPNEKAQKENILSGTLKTLFAVTENYPQLKADRHFSELMQSLQGIESEILASRKYYNGVVKIYNTKREVFPSSIIAKWFKFEKRDLYELESPEERKNIKVQF